MTETLLSLDAAIKQIAEIIRPASDSENVILNDALGRVTATTISAPCALPSFDNTGVDGYAFRHAEATSGALRLIGKSMAGEPFTGVLPANTAIRIATGAVIPEGADTVAMQEYCRIEGDQLLIEPIPKAGDNIRRTGADISEGKQAVVAGHRLAVADIALLAALGVQYVKAQRRLRVAIFSTGAELRSATDKLEAGQIRDSNRPMLRALLSRWPVDLVDLGALPDDRNLCEKALCKASAAHDLVISSGGVSVGDRDYIRDVLQDIGQVHFWKLALRPGKPVMFGQIGDGLILGLPGNPVSVLATFCVVAVPILQALCGMTPSLPPAFSVPLVDAIRKPSHLRSFSRARLVQRNDLTMAEPFSDQSSNLITSLTQSDGLLDLAAGISEFPKGTLVPFRPYYGILS